MERPQTAFWNFIHLFVLMQCEQRKGGAVALRSGFSAACAGRAENCRLRIQKRDYHMEESPWQRGSSISIATGLQRESSTPSSA
jgi:hypothetical protein